VAEPHEFGQLFLDHLDLAWGVIANVGTGNDGWDGQDPVWIQAASEWRDRYHVLLDEWENQ